MLHRHSLLSGAAAVVLAAAGCASSTPNNEHGPTFGPEGGSDVTQGDTGSPDEGTPETGGNEGGGETGPVGDGGVDAAGDSTTADAGEEAAAESGSDAPAETGGDAAFVAPTCDGVIGAGEYGGVADEQASSNGQVWYMTWDATNLYVAISGANVGEGNVIYLAANPGDGGTGLTSGYAYDNTDVTKLPFAADLVVYAKQTYNEARVAGASTWGSPTAGAVQVCVNTSTSIREEVIPWSLVGGLPAAFGWTAYLAANPMSNPAGYVYGQMPVDDPGGGDAGAESFTKYYAVPNATPGVDTPFADEQ
ncbi:MAG TPA: hypothetical protein VF765_36890 [Polyangiaceae bacterium]